MERPNKKDYDFNDNFEAVRFGSNMIKYTDYIEKQLNIGFVSDSILDSNDLTAYAKWIKDKSYSNRLDMIPSDLENFYMRNRESILKQYT